MMRCLEMCCSSQRMQISRQTVCHSAAALMGGCMANWVAAMVVTGWTHSSMAAAMAILQRMLPWQSQTMRLQRLSVGMLVLTWTI